MSDHPENDTETKTDRPAVNEGRRKFLKGAGLAGAGAAAAAATVQGAETPEEQVKTRYRRSAHVERYYFLNRL